MPSIGYVIASAIAGALLNIVASLAGRVLVGLGIAVASYAGLDTGLAFLRDSAFQNLDSLPANVLGLLGVLKVGTCISIVASAYVVRLTLSGLTSGTVKHWIKK
jgi:hypothetical protein